MNLVGVQESKQEHRELKLCFILLWSRAAFASNFGCGKSTRTTDRLSFTSSTGSSLCHRINQDVKPDELMIILQIIAYLSHLAVFYSSFYRFRTKRI